MKPSPEEHRSRRQMLMKDNRFENYKQKAKKLSFISYWKLHSKVQISTASGGIVPLIPHLVDSTEGYP